MIDAGRADFWRALSANWHPSAVMLSLGFAAGLPILLIFSSLSLWLREAGMARGTVTFFSWAALGYSFKFVWAPLVDHLQLPGLSAVLGRRRAWLLCAQMMVIASIVAMALIDPAAPGGLSAMALAAVALGFSSATQDIVIDALRIESADHDVQALLAATYIGGYRLGMLVGGALAIYLAQHFGSEMGAYRYLAWRDAWLCMAGFMLVGVATTLVIAEPVRSVTPPRHSAAARLRFVFVFLAMVLALVFAYRLGAEPAAALRALGTDGGAHAALTGFAIEAVRLAVAIGAAAAVAGLLWRLGLVPAILLEDGYVSPLRDFFARYGRLGWALLVLVGFYKVADIVMGSVANVFYQDMGFDKATIAGVSKVFGVWCTIVGGLAGGALALRHGVMRVLLLGALLSAVTNVLFMTIAAGQPSTAALALVISADNLSAGLAAAAFVAFLSALTNVQFTAVQYALFSSLMTLFPKLLAGYSGSLVDALGYPRFFLLSALLGAPVLALVVWIGRRVDL